MFVTDSKPSVLCLIEKSFMAKNTPAYFGIVTTDDAVRCPRLGEDVQPRRRPLQQLGGDAYVRRKGVCRTGQPRPEAKRQRPRGSHHLVLFHLVNEPRPVEQYH